MSTTRILLIVQILNCLWLALILGCNQCGSKCYPFLGLNGCYDRGIREPKLPPRDNTCCGPHCNTSALNPQTTGPCNSTRILRCLLDTHCGLTDVAEDVFTFHSMSECEFLALNAERMAKGFARFLTFKVCKRTECEGNNKKCGLNCCCRENCPQMFCKF
ncbi:hypothetical protein KR018_001031 [Drosophila ironensis]|nr:hypothetical protein KR018_001031 [Drosophila ironensis]